MVGFRISKESAKSLFFDREKVAAAFDSATYSVLFKFGTYVERAAKGSIRESQAKSKQMRDKSSKPGKPPRSRTGLLRKNIFFYADINRRSVVIGPALLNGTKRLSSKTVPELLEFGGVARSTKGMRAKIADGGRDAKGRFLKDVIGEVPVGTELVYQPRPYMWPAYEKKLPKVAELWRKSIKP